MIPHGKYLITPKESNARYLKINAGLKHFNSDEALSTWTAGEHVEQSRSLLCSISLYRNVPFDERQICHRISIQLPYRSQVVTQKCQRERESFVNSNTLEKKSKGQQRQIYVEREHIHRNFQNVDKRRDASYSNNRLCISRLWQATK